LISSFDVDHKLGGIFICPKCGWFDLDHLLSSDQIKMLQEKNIVRIGQQGISKEKNNE
jgi:hypothetical protein